MRLAVAQIVSTADPTRTCPLSETTPRVPKLPERSWSFFPRRQCAPSGILLDVAEPLDGPWAEAVRDIAQELGIAIVAGMFTPGTDGKGSQHIAGGRSRRRNCYNKIHLFDAFGFAESETWTPAKPQ